MLLYIFPGFGIPGFGILGFGINMCTKQTKNTKKQKNISLFPPQAIIPHSRNVYMCVYVCISIYIYVCVGTYICIYIYIHTYSCVCIHVHVYIYTHT